MILLSNLYSCATYFVIYLWSYHSFRLDADPFLSFSSSGKLRYLLYCDIQTTVKSSASHFGLSETWFNTQSIRMSAPTIARTAKVPIPNIMRMGRWKSVPSALLYQEQSTELNNTILSVVSNSSLFTHRATFSKKHVQVSSGVDMYQGGVALLWYISVETVCWIRSLTIFFGVFRFYFLQSFCLWVRLGLYFLHKTNNQGYILSQ